MTSHSPSEAELPSWLVELERAHQQAGHGALLLGRETDPAADLAPAARAVEAALAAMYDAFDLRGDRLYAIRTAAEQLRRGAAALEDADDQPLVQSAAAALAQAGVYLNQADGHLASRPPVPPRTDFPALLASGDEPRLHQVERASLAPSIRVAPPVAAAPEAPEPFPRPQTFEELASAIDQMKDAAQVRHEQMVALKPKPTPPPSSAPPATPGFASDIPPAIDESAFVRARTRELLEEVTMIGLQRAPLLGDPWRSALILERRMLRAIDGIVAMGAPALSFVESLAFDAPVRDPAWVFGVGMVMGCVQGRDALGVAERVFFDVELTSPECRTEMAAALKLVPHDQLPLMLRTLLADSDPRHRALAIDVLGYRALATEEELSRAATDEPVVAAVALPYLALARSAALIDAVSAALGSEDRALRTAAWRAMALGAVSTTQRTLQGALADDDTGTAARMLALAGDQHDAAVLLERAAATASSSLVAAVGWTGSVVAIGPLMDWLEHDDEQIALTAAYALERITGAGLLEEAELDIEDIEVPEPPLPDVGEPKDVPLVRMVSDPRDLPPEPAAETIEQPTTEAARWRAWWQEHGADFSSSNRYRRGQPYSPRVSLQELDQGSYPPAERRALQEELIIRTGRVVRLDPHDFVSVQERALVEWQPIAESASSQAGSWIRLQPR